MVWVNLRSISACCSRNCWILVSTATPDQEDPSSAERGPPSSRASGTRSTPSAKFPPASGCRAIAPSRSSAGPMPRQNSALRSGEHRLAQPDAGMPPPPQGRDSRRRGRDARILADLGNTDSLLQLIDDGQLAPLHHRETHSRVSAQCGDLQSHSLLLQAVPADRQGSSHRLGPAARTHLFAGDQRQRFFNQSAWHVKTVNLKSIPTPTITAQPRIGDAGQQDRPPRRDVREIHQSTENASEQSRYPASAHRRHCRQPPVT